MRGPNATLELTCVGRSRSLEGWPRGPALRSAPPPLARQRLRHATRPRPGAQAPPPSPPKFGPNPRKPSRPAHSDLSWFPVRLQVQHQRLPPRLALLLSTAGMSAPNNGGGVLQPPPITNPGTSLPDVLDPEAEELYSSRALLIVSVEWNGCCDASSDADEVVVGCLGVAAAGAVILGELLLEG